MAREKLLHGDIGALARAVEEAPLAPRVAEFLDSLELDEYEKTAVAEMIDRLRFRGDTIEAVPHVPPRIFSWDWI